MSPLLSHIKAFRALGDAVQEEAVTAGADGEGLIVVNTLRRQARAYFSAARALETMARDEASGEDGRRP